MLFIVACQVGVVWVAILATCFPWASFGRAIAFAFAANLIYFFGFFTATMIGLNGYSFAACGAVAACIVLVLARQIAPGRNEGTLDFVLAGAVFLGIALTPLATGLGTQRDDIMVLLVWPLGVLSGFMIGRVNWESNKLKRPTV